MLGHSACLVTGVLGELRGVAGPVATRVAYPVDCGCRGEVQQVGDDCCGLGPEVCQGGESLELVIDTRRTL